MRIGYARVSTDDQKLDLQLDALQKAGCEKICTDTISGVKAERPGLTEVFKYLREGDTVVVWKLDRLGRSITHLIQLVQEINNRNASFLSLQENIDTTSSMGKLIFHIFGAIAEFERNLIVERTQAGLKAARARGRFGGREFLLKEKQVDRLMEAYKDRSITVPEICKAFNISKTSLYNYVNGRKNAGGEAARL